MKTDRKILKSVMRLIFSLIVINQNIFLEHAQAQQLSFRNYSVKEGMSQSQVNDIAQDKFGYLWFATAEGLTSFDGSNFTQHSKKEGLAGTFINKILVDSEGDLWLGHRAMGISRYITDEKRVEKIVLPEGLKNANIKDIYEEKPGVFWFATDGQGLLKYENKRWIIYNQKNGLPSKKLLALSGIRGEIWIGSDEGIIIFDRDLKEGLRFNLLDEKSGAPSGDITAFLKDAHGDIWIGTSKAGLFKYTLTMNNNRIGTFSNISLQNELNESSITCLFEDVEHNIWLATSKRGVIRYTPPRATEDQGHVFVINKDNGLELDDVTSIFQGREGSLWFGTDGAGVYQYRGKCFEKYGKKEGLLDDLVWAIYEDKKGGFWFGSEEGLTHVQSVGKMKRKNRIRYYTSKNWQGNSTIIDIQGDSRGHLWLCLHGTGVREFNPVTRSFRKISNLENKDIICVEEDGEGNLWFGSFFTGVYRFNPKTGDLQNYKADDGIGSNTVFNILRAKDNTLWFATNGAGITKFDGRTFTNYGKEQGFSAPSVLSLADDTYGNLWIGTEGDGLFKYDGKSFQNYSQIYDVWEDDIYSLICDKENMVWIGTRQGIEKLIPSTGEIKKYGEFEGFSAIETNQNAVLKDSNSRLWFGTINGAIRYNSEEDKKNMVAPITYVQRVRVYLQDLPLPEDNRFSYTKNHLTFSFIGVCFVVPEKVKYSYMLEGLDRDWSPLSEERYATYANIPPGDYKFKVKARNDDNIWSEEAAIYEFSISAPFWLQSWFYLLIVGLISSAVYSGHKYRVRTINRNNIRLEEMVHSRTKDLVSEKEKTQKAYDAVLESEDMYRRLIELSPDAIVVHSEGKIDYINEAGIKLYGAKSIKELLGRPLTDLSHPDYRSLGQKRVQQIYNEKKEVGLMEQKMIRLDGREFYVEVTGAPIIYKGKASGQSIVRDITEKKKMEEELQKSQKLESVGLLAGGIAHDFNNILTAILGNISLGKLYSDSKSNAKAVLGEAEKATLHAKELTQQLLTFSKGGAPVKESTSILEIIKESTSFVLSGSKIDCEYDCPSDLWAVEVDTAQISQVIQNLIINAEQAMPNGKMIRIKFQNISLKEKVVPGLKPGKYVKITIKDEGIGIPEEHLNKIFDPYFTTKQKGSGLGLATSYSIIKRHEGFIQIKSKIGIGTEVELFLPASEKQVPQRQKTGDIIESGNGRILVMDDEKMLCEISEQFLTHLGYEVLTVPDGETAVKAYKQAQKSGKPFSLVIMDLTIPGGLGGKETITKLREIDPQVKAIVSSGYSNDPVMAKFKDYGFLGVLIKPYKIEAMSTTIASIINGKSSRPSE